MRKKKRREKEWGRVRGDRCDAKGGCVIERGDRKGLCDRM